MPEPAMSIRQSLWANFLGTAPVWYKQTILAILIVNPLIYLAFGGTVAGWALVLEFIFTLAMALQCYPLQPGGLLALEAVLLGLTSPETIRYETFNNFPVILLLMFMVAGVYFMRELLLFIFTKVVLTIKSKILLNIFFLLISAVLSAFLDALTLVAVVITVVIGFYTLYHKVASGLPATATDHDSTDDRTVAQSLMGELNDFRTFLRGLIMHSAVGTALGGVCTIVGEPQNLLIANQAGWGFMEFFFHMAPVTMPVLAVGILTCVLLEHFKLFSYGSNLPDNIRQILLDYDREMSKRRTGRDQALMLVQLVAIISLVFMLGFHVAEVGIIGLTIIIIQTALGGTVDEHKIGHAFREAMPFTSLLVVFFCIVAVIEDQHLFTPIIERVLLLSDRVQPVVLYMVNGLLSAISDNVFVATVYISEIKGALDSGMISRELFDRLAIAINTGTNIPSVATPNGQAAFLFLLTSPLAPMIHLSYVRMLYMALPYTITMSTVGMLAVYFLV